MNTKDFIDAFSYFSRYMFNVWSEKEAIAIFGQQLGEYLYAKWLQYDEDALKWFDHLDFDNERKIIERAMTYYTKPIL